MEKVRILLTGSYGQLGSEIVALAAGYPNLDFKATDADTLDITNPEQVHNFFQEYRPDYVVNCAAYTAVDQAEDEPEKAMLLNGKAPGILAEACKKHESRFIQISTDYVFDGMNYRPYNEDEPANPIGVYGKTKLEGESRCLAAYSQTIIIRTSWLYSVYGNNFVKTMLRLGKEKEKLTVIFDQVGSPTNAAGLAYAVLEIVRKCENGEAAFVPGIYHYSNEGVCSWYDFALAVFEMAGISCNVTPVKSEEYKTKAKRPHYSVLDKSKIKITYNMEIPYWRDSLSDCIKKLIKE